MLGEAFQFALYWKVGIIDIYHFIDCCIFCQMSNYLRLTSESLIELLTYV